MMKYKKSDLVEFVSGRGCTGEQIWSFAIVMDIREDVLGGSSSYGGRLMTFAQINNPKQAEILIMSIDGETYSWIDEMRVRLVNKE